MENYLWFLFCKHRYHKQHDIAKPNQNHTKNVSLLLSKNCLPPPSMENRSTLFSGFPLENKPQKENVYNLPGPIKDHLLIDTSAVQCSRAPHWIQYITTKNRIQSIGKNIVMLANMLRL